MGDVLLVDVDWVDRELRSEGGRILAASDAFADVPPPFSADDLARERRGFGAALHIREAATDREKADRILVAARLGDSAALQSEIASTLFGLSTDFDPEVRHRLNRRALELALPNDGPAHDRWRLWYGLRCRVPFFYRDGDPRERMVLDTAFGKYPEPDSEWDRAFRRRAADYAEIVLPRLRSMLTSFDVDETDEGHLLGVARNFVPFLGQDDPSSPLLEGLRPLLIDYSERRCEDDEVVRVIETIVERTWNE